MLVTAPVGRSEITRRSHTHQHSLSVPLGFDVSAASTAEMAPKQLLLLVWLASSEAADLLDGVLESTASSEIDSEDLFAPAKGLLSAFAHKISLDANDDGMISVEDAKEAWKTAMTPGWASAAHTKAEAPAQSRAAVLFASWRDAAMAAFGSIVGAFSVLAYQRRKSNAAHDGVADDEAPGMRLL